MIAFYFGKVKVHGIYFVEGLGEQQSQAASGQRSYHTDRQGITAVMKNHRGVTEPQAFHNADLRALHADHAAQQDDLYPRSDGQEYDREKSGHDTAAGQLGVQ